MWPSAKDNEEKAPAARFIDMDEQQEERKGGVQNSIVIESKWSGQQQQQNWDEQPIIAKKT